VEEHHEAKRRKALLVYEPKFGLIQTKFIQLFEVIQGDSAKLVKAANYIPS